MKRGGLTKRIAVKSVSLFISILLLSESPAFPADGLDLARSSNLSASLATSPICEVKENENGSWDILSEGDDVLDGIDFQKRWIVMEAGLFIARSLRHQISPKFIVPRLKAYLEDRNLLKDLTEEGYDIDNIRETRQVSGETTEIFLPVRRPGERGYDLRFSFERHEGSKSIHEYTRDDGQRGDIFVSKVYIDEPAAGSGLCDHSDELISLTAQSLTTDLPDDPEVKAEAIARWVKNSVTYSTGYGAYWDVKASETLQLGKGMCFNLSNLFVAMVRSMGMKAEFGVVKVRKEAFKNMVPPRRYEEMKDTYAHVFARVMIKGKWKAVDLVYAGEGKQLREKEVFSPYVELSTLFFSENIDDFAFLQAAKRTRKESDSDEDHRIAALSAEVERVSSLPRPQEAQGIDGLREILTVDFDNTRTRLEARGAVEVKEDEWMSASPGEEDLFMEIVECKALAAVNLFTGERFLSHFLPRGFTAFQDKGRVTRKEAVGKYLEKILGFIMEEESEAVPEWSFYLTEGPFSFSDPESLRLEEIKDFLLSVGVPEQLVYFEKEKPGFSRGVSSKFVTVNDRGRISVIREKAPKGSPATLLREMHIRGVYENRKKSRRSLQSARKVNNSKTTLLTEISALREAELLEGGPDGYYLKDWLRYVDDIEKLIFVCPALENRSQTPEEMDEIRDSVRMLKENVLPEEEKKISEETEERVKELLLMLEDGESAAGYEPVSRVTGKIFYELLRLSGMGEPGQTARVLDAMVSKVIIDREMISSGKTGLLGKPSGAQDVKAMPLFPEEPTDYPGLDIYRHAREYFGRGEPDYSTSVDKENFRLAMMELVSAGHFVKLGKTITGFIDSGKMEYARDFEVIDDFIFRSLYGYDPEHTGEKVLEKLLDTRQISYDSYREKFTALLERLMTPRTADRAANLIALLAEKGEIIYSEEKDTVDPVIEMCMKYAYFFFVEKILISLLDSGQISYFSKSGMLEVMIMSALCSSRGPHSSWRLILKLLESGEMSYSRDRNFLVRFIHRSFTVPGGEEGILKVVSYLLEKGDISYFSDTVFFDGLFDLSARYNLARLHADLLIMLMEDPAREGSSGKFYDIIKKGASEVMDVAAVNVLVLGYAAGTMDTALSLAVFERYLYLKYGKNHPDGVSDARVSSIAAFFTYLSRAPAKEISADFPETSYLHVPVRVPRPPRGRVSGIVDASEIEHEIAYGRVLKRGGKYYFPVRNPYFYFSDIHNRSMVFKTAGGDIVYKGVGLSRAAVLEGILMPVMRGTGFNVLYGGLPRTESSIGMDVALREKYAQFEREGEPFLALAKEYGADIDMIRSPVAEVTVELFPVAVTEAVGHGLSFAANAAKTVFPGAKPVPGIFFPRIQDILDFAGIRRDEKEERDAVIYVYKVPSNLRLEEMTSPDAFRPFLEYFDHTDADGSDKEARRKILLSAASRFSAFIRIAHDGLGFSCSSEYGTVFSEHNVNPLVMFDYDTIVPARQETEKTASYRQDISDAEGLIRKIWQTLELEEKHLKEALGVFERILSLESAPKTGPAPEKGTPAALLRYMSSIGAYRVYFPGESGPQRQSEMANKRGGNDSATTISREAAVLRRVNLLEGDKNGPLYLASWLRYVEDIGSLINSCQFLDVASPGFEQIEVITKQVRKIKAETLEKLASEDEEGSLIYEIEEYLDRIGAMFDWLMTREYGERYTQANCYGAAHVLRKVLDAKFGARGADFRVRENDYRDTRLGELRWVEAELPSGKKLFINGVDKAGSISVWELSSGIERSGLVPETEHDPDDEGVIYDHSRIEAVTGDFLRFTSRGRYERPEFGALRALLFPSGLLDASSETKINKYTVHSPGSVMEESGMFHCNTLFAYDESTGIGASSHVSLIHLRVLPEDRSVAAVKKALEEIVEEMALLGADRYELKFAAIKRDMSDYGEGPLEDAEYTNRLLFRALAEMGYHAKRLVVKSDSAFFDLGAGTILDGGIKPVYSFASTEGEVSSSIAERARGETFNLLELAQSMDLSREKGSTDEKSPFESARDMMLSDIREIRELLALPTASDAYMKDVDGLIEWAEKTALTGVKPDAVISYIEDRDWTGRREDSAETPFRQALYDMVFLSFAYYGRGDLIRFIDKMRSSGMSKKKYVIGPKLKLYLDLLSAMEVSETEAGIKLDSLRRYSERVSVEEEDDEFAEREKSRSRDLTDVVRAMEISHGEEPVIVAVGTGWIKGYEEGTMQYNAINPLLSSIREYLREKGIPMVLCPEEDLPAAIEDVMTREKMPEGTRVIALGGISETLRFSEEMQALADAPECTVVGVRSSELSEMGYIRVVEMLTMAMNLSLGFSPGSDNPNILVLPPDPAEGRRFFVFVPLAEPVSYELLKRIYSLQRFA